MTSTTGPASVRRAACSSSAGIWVPVKIARIPGAPVKINSSGERRGRSRTASVPASSRERVITASRLLRPERGGPAMRKVGAVPARSVPTAVSSSPPTPIMAHSGFSCGSAG